MNLTEYTYTYMYMHLCVCVCESRLQRLREQVKFKRISKCIYCRHHYSVASIIFHVHNSCISILYMCLCVCLGLCVYLIVIFMKETTITIRKITKTMHLLVVFSKNICNQWQMQMHLSHFSINIPAEQSQLHSLFIHFKTVKPCLQTRLSSSSSSTNKYY